MVATLSLTAAAACTGDDRVTYTDDLPGANAAPNPLDIPSDAYPVPIETFGPEGDEPTAVLTTAPTAGGTGSGHGSVRGNSGNGIGGPAFVEPPARERRTGVARPPAVAGTPGRATGMPPGGTPVTLPPRPPAEKPVPTAAGDRTPAVQQVIDRVKPAAPKPARTRSRPHPVAPAGPAQGITRHRPARAPDPDDCDPPFRPGDSGQTMTVARRGPALLCVAGYAPFPIPWLTIVNPEGRQVSVPARWVADDLPASWYFKPGINGDPLEEDGVYWFRVDGLSEDRERRLISEGRIVVTG
ncbi:hypothetical protein [Actinoplanes sp. NPDC051851]|uniref:hypothetical protein n=1 Tax=Actinoplanes sp. NPDC051851 TaxID=3154753 RepID=UPI00342C384E